MFLYRLHKFVTTEKAEHRMRSGKNAKKLDNHIITPINLLAAAIIIIAVIGIVKLLLPPSNTDDNSNSFSGLEDSLFPAEGFETNIILGDLIPKLVENGVIDMDKLKQVYASRGGMPDDQLKLFTTPSSTQLALTKENSAIMLNILWGLGIANKNPILDETANYSGVANLASTGGWTLGKDDAMSYFNKMELVKLMPEQQSTLEEVAKNAYRPCCDNPTAFPDCNHGAALLALLELGASQGMGKAELYQLALEANTLWFPQQYLITAAYFQTKGMDYWPSAQEIMSAKYSSASGWSANIYKPMQAQGLLPKTTGGGSCGV